MIWQATSRREIELIEKQGRIEETLADFQAKIPEPAEDLSWEIRTILIYIHRHLFDPDLNVTAVRRRFQLRNNNVSTRFRCIVGMGLRGYIEAARMLAAKRLLRHQDLEIYLIAMAVGYEHQETFCRAFQRQAKCTPSEWRATSGDRRQYQVNLGSGSADITQYQEDQRLGLRQAGGLVLQTAQIGEPALVV